jgi:hypothetical protein
LTTTQKTFTYKPHHIIWQKIIGYYYTQSLNNLIHLDNNNIAQWKNVFTPLSTLKVWTRKICHLPVLTSRYILLQRSHISLKVPKRLGSFSFTMTWRINKKQTTNNTQVHNYFEIPIALIFFLSSTHLYYHASFLRRNIV